MSAVKTARESIAELLAPMFKEAEAQGLWFYSSYQGLWFSPAQLKAQQASGRFVWGPVNWRLRDPRERVTEAETKAAAAQNEVERIKAEIAAHPVSA